MAKALLLWFIWQVVLVFSYATKLKIEEKITKNMPKSKAKSKAKLIS
jgi:hypothetical protein